MAKDKPFIVIVDDDASVCRAIRRLVRSLGIEADTFTSGQEFIELLDNTPFLRVDCLVLDVQMPGMNGLEIQRRLKKQEPSIPIVFITAHDDTGVRDRALAAGAVAILRKPFSDDLFIKTVQEAFKRNSEQSQAR